MNAAFGGVSAGGVGSPLSDVTQSGDGPCALVASHPTGNAGGVTSSKFSLNVTRLKHGGHRSPLRICAIVGATATPAAMSNSKTSFRSRVGVSVCFRFFSIAEDVQTMFLRIFAERCQFFSPHHVSHHSRRPTVVKSVCAFPR